MKFAMKHGGLCSMSFVLRICLCVVFLCTWVAFLCACEGNASKISNTGVEESTYVLQSGIGTDAATSLEGQPVMRKGYNPQMDFAYDEHDDVDIDENYVGSLCGEATKELETMFGQQKVTKMTVTQSMCIIMKKLRHFQMMRWNR